MLSPELSVRLNKLLPWAYKKQTYGHQRGNMAGRNKSGAWDEYMHTTAYKLDDQQGPSVQHRELSPILSDNLYEKIIF